MTLLQSGITKSLAEDYTIDQSLRFESDDSAFLSRTPTSAGNTTQWTFSAWVKRGVVSQEMNIFSAGQGGGSEPRAEFKFNSDDTYEINISGVTGSGRLQTTQVFRDPGAWYHIMLVYDSPNSTEEDRMIFYVNGSRIADGDLSLIHISEPTRPY